MQAFINCIPNCLYAVDEGLHDSAMHMLIKIDIRHLLFGSVHSQPYPMHCSATAFLQLTLFLLDSICNRVCRPDHWFQVCKQCDMPYAKHPLIIDCYAEIVDILCGLA